MVVPEKTTGTVKIINEYPVEIPIIVNTTSYRVAPNKVLDVEVPAGDFSYQLITTIRRSRIARSGRAKPSGCELGRTVLSGRGIGDSAPATRTSCMRS